MKTDLEGFFYSDGLNNYEILRGLFDLNSDSLIYNLFEVINKSVAKKDRYAEYKKIVHNNISRTNLIREYDQIREIVEEQAKYIDDKNFKYLFYLLALSKDQYRESNTYIRDVEKLNKYLNNAKGNVITFFHYGMFQLLLPLIVSSYPQNKFALIASTISIDFQKKIFDVFYPELTGNFLPISVDDFDFKEMQKLIDSGVNICIMPEINTNSSNQKFTLDFFGQSIYAPLGAAAISVLNHTNLIGMYITENEERTLNLDTIFFNMPIDKTRGNIENLTRLQWDIIKQLCTENPSLWFGWEVFDKMMVEK